MFVSLKCLIHLPKIFPLKDNELPPEPHFLLDLMRRCEFGPAVRKQPFSAAPPDHLVLPENSTACSVTCCSVRNHQKSGKCSCIHLSDHLNTYMTDTTPCESWFYRKGFSLIISKLITHLVDEAGRGHLEVDHVSYPPRYAST